MKRALIASLALACAAAPTAFAQEGANYTKPKTTWGAPDIAGLWTNQSLTAMQRPEGTTKLVLTQKEAEDLAYHNTFNAAARQEAHVSKLDAESSAKLLSDKNSNRAYNTFWMELGTNYAKVKGKIRSSWITYPDSGKIPYSQAGIAANTRAGSSTTIPKGGHCQSVA